MQLESSLEGALQEEETLARRRANRMVDLEDSAGRWCMDDSEIKPLIISYFQEIFTMCSPTNIESITDCVQPRVTTQQNSYLTRQISSKEIWLAMKSLNPTKSPGPDGFMWKFFNSIGTWLTHLVLIPKIATPRKMTQWKPIALCNLVYKTISKILTARLKALLPKIISLNQFAFIEDQLIIDNILIIHEILHSLKKECGMGRSNLALKLDIAKAYDQVEWPFVELMMRRTYYTFLGSSSGQSSISFFISVCAEGLSAMIKKHEEMGALQGFRFHPQGVSISHMFSPMIQLYFAKLMNVRLDA
ncbi:unnamed protein product [Prunus armeniaca]